MTLDMILQPEVLVSLDMAVLAALTITILVGLRMCSRLKALRKTHAEWNKELQTFAERADAAEAGLERLRTALIAEAEHKRTMERIAEEAAPRIAAPVIQDAYRPAPEAEVDFFDEAPPVPKAGPETKTKRRGADAVLSMQ
jgi:hypothetical protein